MQFQLKYIIIEESCEVDKKIWNLGNNKTKLYTKPTSNNR